MAPRGQQRSGLRGGWAPTENRSVTSALQPDERDSGTPLRHDGRPGRTGDGQVEFEHEHPLDRRIRPVRAEKDPQWGSVVGMTAEDPL